MLNADQRLEIFLNRLGTPAFDSFWLLASEKWVWIPLYVALAYLLVKNFGWKRTLYLCLFIALGLTISDQLAGVFKMSLHRLRPCRDPEVAPLLRPLTCGGPYGFYSAHASNSFFLTAFLWNILGKTRHNIRLVLLGWALVVSYSRLYLGMHYPLDVAMGAAVGFLLGKTMEAVSQLRKNPTGTENPT